MGMTTTGTTGVKTTRIEGNMFRCRMKATSTTPLGARAIAVACLLTMMTVSVNGRNGGRRKKKKTKRRRKTRRPPQRCPRRKPRRRKRRRKKKKRGGEKKKKKKKKKS